MDTYMVRFRTKDGARGCVRLPSIERVQRFIGHSLKLGDNITSIRKLK